MNLLKRILSMVGITAPTETRTERQFPPVPKWRPTFSISNDEVLERLIHYFNDQADLVVFEFGTAVLVPDGLNDGDAKQFAREALSRVFHFHPDMEPLLMDDGNILISYNGPVYNVVKDEFAVEHIDTILARHLDALATDEVLFTPAGPNKFDEFGMKALYGRAFMFMDAQDPDNERIYRH